MKKLTLFLFLISIVSFAQDSCKVSVMKHSGTSNYKKSSLKLIEQLDVDKDCNYHVLSFTVEFTTDKHKEQYKFDLPGNRIPEKVSKHLIEADDKIIFSNILVGTGYSKDKRVTMPDIVLQVVK
jgi:hypothetical protein